MFRLDRIAVAAGGLLARAALGVIGLAILIGWSTPRSDPAATASFQPDDPTQTAMTVTLRVPEGALATHLSVVDASGRELAFLSHWMTGMTTVVSRRSRGAGVSYHLNTDGSANLLVEGTAGVTPIHAETDGTTRVSPRGVRPGVSPRTTIDPQTRPGSDE
jgi:hypothetical protein